MEPHIPLNALQWKTRTELELWLLNPNHSSPVTTCKGCLRNSFQRIAISDRFGLPFRSLLCLECGLVSTDPTISTAHIQEYYERFYTPLTMGRSGDDAPEFLVDETQGKKIFDFVSDHFSGLGKNRLRIAEIGCGSGRNLSDIRELAAGMNIETDIYGCEYSSYYKDKAVRELHINYEIGGPESLSSIGVKFDLIILSHVFEHLTEPIKTLRESGDLLAKNGAIYIEVPGILSFQNRKYYGGILERYLTHAHLHNFCLDSLSRMIWPFFTVIKGNEDVQTLLIPGQSEDKPDHATTAQTIEAHLEWLARARSPRSRQIAVNARNSIDSGRLDQTLAFLDKESPQKYEDAPELILLRIECLHGLGRSVEAITLAEELTRRWPSMAEAWHDLAILHYEAGSLEKSRYALKNARKLAPFEQSYTELDNLLNGPNQDIKNIDACHSE